eukprot:TRINITY_DN3938_c4_g1_i1.p1 TRINITY_DN3938_c4_g1~~TRINITY_DN3938_c4_g1_i1.p1  ORF type:complete len:183 (+),score=43.60 TRINITY_DN3938_c4_g1_i1:357-905(+)
MCLLRCKEGEGGREERWRDEETEEKLQRDANVSVFADCEWFVGFLMTLVGGGGGQSDWYRKLHKAAFNPPGWVFGPVWTTIYTLCGIAVWRIVQVRGGFKPAKKELIVYGVQLLANMLWTPFFFGMHLIVVSFIWLLVIDVLVIANIYVFWKVDKASGAMLIPYICWGLFASVLSGTIVATN